MSQLEVVQGELDAARAEAAATRADLSALRREASSVMASLEQYGSGIVGHLLDNDDNAGERLRQLLAAAVPTPTEDACTCDGAAYHTAAENAARSPFVVNDGCPVHRPSTPEATAPEPETMTWHVDRSECEYEMRETCAMTVISWIKRNSGEARYESDVVQDGSRNGGRWFTSRIAVRTINGWAHAKPDDTITMTDKWFGAYGHATRLREFTVSSPEATS